MREGPRPKRARTSGNMPLLKTMRLGGTSVLLRRCFDSVRVPRSSSASQTSACCLLTTIARQKRAAAAAVVGGAYAPAPVSETATALDHTLANAAKHDTIDSRDDGMGGKEGTLCHAAVQNSQTRLAARAVTC